MAIKAGDIYGGHGKPIRVVLAVINDLVVWVPATATHIREFKDNSGNKIMTLANAREERGE